MNYAVLLTKKQIEAMLRAIKTQIAADVARYQITPPSEDAAGDYGNDLHALRRQRDALQAQLAEGPGTARIYACWFDPEDNGLSLMLAAKVAAERARDALSAQARLLYSFTAHTGEEAMAIHHLRQGWAPYVPHGAAAPCPACASTYYPEGYGDCWHCGHIG
jgi:hypothetical protein